MKKDKDKGIKGIDPNRILEEFQKQFGSKAPKMLEQYLKSTIKKRGK